MGELISIILVPRIQGWALTGTNSSKKKYSPRRNGNVLFKNENLQKNTIITRRFI